MELLSLVQHSILVEGEQTTQGDVCSLSLYIEFSLSCPRASPVIHPLPCARTKTSRKIFLKELVLGRKFYCSNANSAPHLGTGNTVSKRISSKMASNEL